MKKMDTVNQAQKEHSLLSLTEAKHLRLQAKKQPLILSVASGKGGVGKTLTTINFALSACQQGYKVLILDGDLGLSNIDVVLGMQAKYNIRDVFDGTVALAEIILEGPLGMKVIPSGSGITSLQTLTYTQRQILSQEIARLPHDFDLLLIDTGAGIGCNVLHLNSLSHRRIIVTTPEPHAITDAYALIKVLAEERNLGSFDLLVNMAHSAPEAKMVAERIQKVAKEYLGVQVNYLGRVPFDRSMSQAVLKRQAGSSASTHSLAGQAWHQLASSVLGEARHKRSTTGLKEFWGALVDQSRNHAYTLASS